MKSLKQKARRILVGITSLSLFGGAIIYGSLSANDEIVYSEQETMLMRLSQQTGLERIEVQKGEEIVTTCTYPQEADKPLCDGFSVREDGVYMTASLEPGSIEEGYTPYTYHFYINDEQETSSTEMEIKRQPNDAQLSLQEGTLQIGEQALPFVSDAQTVVFTSDDPDHVSFKDGNVTILEGGKEQLLITASIPETSQVEGKSIQALFTIEQPQPQTVPEEIEYPEKIEQLSEDNIALLKMSSADANEWNGEFINLSVEVSLQNKDEMFTQSFVGAIPNFQVQLQAQFVNLLNDSNVPDDLTSEKIEDGTLTQAEIDALFAGKTWMGGSAIDTSKPYTDKDAKLWVQYLSVPFPKEEGIYITRYRLFNKYSGEVQPIVMDGKVYSEESGYFDTVMRNGIDITPPIVQVDAKRDGESDYHEMQNGELLGNNAQIKITANGDIAGIKTQKYQFVANGSEIKESEWKPIPSDGIVVAPNDFGGTLEVSVSDHVALDENRTKFRATTVSKQILAPVDYIVVTLPQASQQWISKEKGILWLIEPTNHSIDYDGVLMTFVNLDTNAVDKQFVNKNAFVQKQYEFALEDGEWQISAEVVKNDSADSSNPSYRLVNEASQTTTQLSIDNTAEVSAVKGTQSKETYGITVRGTSGPSGIQSIKRTVSIATLDGDRTYTSIIHPDATGEYKDKASLNGTYTYELTNGAGKVSTPASVSISGLNHTAPVLDIHAKDSMGNEVQSGDTADKYIVISADDINPNSDGSKIQICINGICKDYTPGEDVMVDEDATIIFKDSDGEELGKFEVTITGNYNLGVVEITNEDQFGDDVWLSEDTVVEAALNGGDPEVYLEAKIGGGNYQKVEGKTVQLPITQADNTSSQTLVLVRSSDGEHVSQPQRVMVNIDKVSPTLVIKQEHNQLNSQSIASFTIRVGGSGLASASVKDETGTKNLASYIEQKTLKDYPMEMNGTYTFTITAGNGRSTTKEVTVTGLNENKIHVTPLVGDIDKAVSYTGTWTKENVTFTLSGGLQDMAEFKSYQKKTSKGTWEDCGDTITFTEDQEDTIQFRVLLKDDTTSSETIPYSVKIDNTPPSDPVITLHKVNDHQVANFLRAITFNMFLKEGRVAEITCSDTGSPVTIYYQFADASGKYDTDLSSSKWVKYEDALTLDKEGKVAIVAYAVDEAGNPSDITDGDGMVFDFTAPVLMGVDGESGYIPRTIAYQDSLSGLADTQIFKFNDVDQSLAQGTKLKEPGTYHFEISDRAGNVLIKDFTLKPIPNPDDIDGSDESKDIIDEIQDEFDKNKDDMDEDTKKDIQDKIDEIEEAFQKQRVDHLEDPETGATLDGIEETTFPKDAVLTVRRISEEVSEGDRAGYESLADRLSEKADITDLYEVKITLDGKELEIHGSATLTIQRAEETERFAYIEETAMKELQVTKTETGFASTITHTGRYATLIKDQNHGGDSDQVDHLEDEESGASIDGIDGATFPKDAILRVVNITSMLDEEEKSSYQMQALELEKELQDVYEVTLTYDGKAISLEGSADLRIPMDTTPDGIACIQEDMMQEQNFTQEEGGVRMEITSVGRYVMLKDLGNKNPNGGDDDTSDGSQGRGHSTLGNYFGGGVNTGDAANTVILFTILTMSFVILRHMKSVVHEEGEN